MHFPVNTWRRSAPTRSLSLLLLAFGCGPKNEQTPDESSTATASTATDDSGTATGDDPTPTDPGPTATGEPNRSGGSGESGDPPDTTFRTGARIICGLQYAEDLREFVGIDPNHEGTPRHDRRPADHAAFG